MCNIGAGAALGILEKLNITSKACRAIGMVTGIILTGVIGGSKMANFITDKVSKKVGIKDIKEKADGSKHYYLINASILEQCLHDRMQT